MMRTLCIFWAMPAFPLVQALRRALVVVDVTVEEMVGIHFQRDEMIQTIKDLAQSGQFDALVDSHFWFDKDSPPSSFAELKPTLGRAGTPGADLIPELRGLGLDFVPKYQYSSFAGGSPLEAYLRNRSIEEVVITGINTDMCVLATALDSFYARFKTRVVNSGVSTFNGQIGQIDGLAAIKRYLCVGGSCDGVVGPDVYLKHNVPTILAQSHAKEERSPVTSRAGSSDLHNIRGRKSLVL